MKALTICQPYAELIVRGEKVIENRTWPTAYRGPLAIHAGKSRAWMTADDQWKFPAMVFGAIVATATLRDCVRVADLPAELRDNEHANGPWCWLLSDVTGLVPPVPCCGAMGLWEWSPDQEPGR